MADEARNVEILKAAYKRWSDSKGGSVDDWLKICADNIAFGSLAQGAAPKAQYLTAYSSRDALKDYFAGLARDWEMIEFVTEHFVAQGDRVVMLGRCAWRYKKTGKVVSTPQGRFLALRRRQGGRVLRVLRHRAGARGGGVSGTALRAMNVFVAGATGVIGQPLLKLLRDAGHAVTGTTRSAGKIADDRGARRARRGGRCVRRRGAAAGGGRGEARRRHPSAHRSAGRERSGANGRGARKERAAADRRHAQPDGGGEGRGRAARGGAEHRLRLRAGAEAATGRAIRSTQARPSA